MRTDDLVVRVQTLGERWETLGVERFAGVRPENVQLSSNEWGPDTVQFKMRRDAGVAHPDLSAFTPCEVEVAGQVVWDGRVKETPSKEGSDAVVNVSGEGWQYHLDDDVYRNTYLTTDLTQFKDARSYLYSDLTVWNAAGTVNVGDGKIVLGQAIGTAWGNNKGQAVVLDMGPDTRGAKSIGLTISTLNTAGNSAFTFIARGFDPDGSTGAVQGSWSSAFNASGAPFASLSGQQDAIYLSNGNFNGTFFGILPSSRYVALIFGWNGAGGTTGADALVTITSVRVFGDDTYQQNSVSSLRSSDLVNDAVARTSPLLRSSIKPNSYYDEVASDAGQYSTVSFATGGMRYWRMSGTGSTEVDRSSGTTLNLTGTYTRGQAGALSGDTDGSTLFANGYGDESLGSVPAINLTGCSWSIECWAKRSGLSNTRYQIFASLGVATTDQGAFVGLSPSGFLCMGHANDDFISTTAIADTNWHHVVATYNIITRVMALYLDGVQIGTRTAVTPTTATGAVRVGAAAWDAAQWFAGSLDEVAVYFAGQNDAYYPTNLGMALSPQRVAWHFLAGQQRSNGSIQQSAFILPQFDMDAAKTGREVILAANAFQNWRSRLKIGREVEFAPKPAAPLFAVGPWAGAEFEDASANSAEDLFNQVRLEAEDNAGVPLVVSRQASTLTAPGAGVRSLSSGQPVNPDFEVDASGWDISNVSGGTATVTRDTSLFDSGVASGKMTATSATGQFTGIKATGNIAGVFRAGVTYTLSFRLRYDGGFSYGFFWMGWGMNNPRGNGVTQSLVSFYAVDTVTNFNVATPIGQPMGPGELTPVPSGSWITVQMPWTPKVDTPLSGSLVGVNPWYDVQVFINLVTVSNSPTFASGQVQPSGSSFHVDGFNIYGPGGNIIDKRGFRRTKVLPIQNKMTIPAMQQIGDVWLRDHFTQPLKGSIAVHGQGGVRRLGSSLPLHPASLLAESGELVRLSHAIEPDTGAIGRDGRIAGVQYDHDSRSAQVTLDNSRGNVEAFLARLAVVAK